MSAYTRLLNARGIIMYIANERKEESHEKIREQRDWIVDICKEWLEYNTQNGEKK